MCLFSDLKQLTEFDLKSCEGGTETGTAERSKQTEADERAELMVYSKWRKKEMGKKQKQKLKPGGASRLWHLE